MKHTGRGIAFLLVVALLILSPLRAFADGPNPLAIDETRTDTYPQVDVKLTVNNDGSLGAARTFTDQDFVVEENGQKVEPLIVRRLQDDRTPISIVLGIDVSGSMNDQGKLQKAKDAAKTFIAQLRSIDRVEVITFSDKVNTIISFTNDRTALAKAIDGITAKGNTALFDAADQAVSDAIRAEGTKVVVLLTDGEDNASKVPISQTIDRARQASVAIFTIGLGSNVKDDVLNSIAVGTGARYYKAPKPEDLTYAFKLLSQQIANRYEISYYSPLDAKLGTKIDVTISVVWNGESKAQTSFTYLAPLRQASSGLPAALAPAVDPGKLRQVIDPTPTPTTTTATPDPLPWYADYAAAVLGSLGIVALFAGTSMRLTRGPMESRLAAFVETTRPSRRSQQKQASGGRHVLNVARAIAARVAKLLPAQRIEMMREQLMLAGNPYGWGVEEYLGIRSLLAIVLGGYVYIILLRNGPLQSLLFAIAAGALGFLLPSIWLGRKIKARQKAVFKAMPNALDLLAVSVEAGLGFDQAIAEVCGKWRNALTEEFDILLAELRMGRTRREALKGLQERTGVPELGGFASALIQADELGASIARTLTVQAEQIRIRRRQRAEEEARKAGIKMLFPLVFLMFPALFVVILGPSIPIFMQGFSQAPK